MSTLQGPHHIYLRIDLLLALDIYENHWAAPAFALALALALALAPPFGLGDLRWPFTVSETFLKTAIAPTRSLASHKAQQQQQHRHNAHDQTVVHFTGIHSIFNAFHFTQFMFYFILMFFHSN